jgi:hypothetical protein
MYYEDLELCRYHSGPFDADTWGVPLLTIGWLEHPNAFHRGPTPQGLVLKLLGLVARARATYPHYYFLGVHTCSICQAGGLPSPGPIWSQENIFVPGVEQIYIAPGGIAHYVEFHSYLPPQPFIEAVMLCPEYGSLQYCDALRTSNAGKTPPLETSAENRAKFAY